MVLNPLYGFDELPATSAAAIREFNDRYLAALAVSKPTGWADTLGELVPTNRPMVTFPVNQLRTLYRRTEGEQRFKKLREASFDVKTEEFDDGYQAKVTDILYDIFAYRQWSQAPSRLVNAEAQFRHLQVAALLSAGTSIPCVDKQNFFSATHPANIVDPTVPGTWSNYQSTATNVLGSQATGNTGVFVSDYLQREVTAGQTSVLDENGQLLGWDPDTIVVPMDYAEPLRVGLANERLFAFNGTAAAAVENVYKGRFNIVPVKEFSMASGTTADWYLIDSKLVKEGIAPWVALRQTMPTSLALRVYDESSDFFKDTGDIKMSSHIWYGFALALPHAIRRIKGPTR